MLLIWLAEEQLPVREDRTCCSNKRSQHLMGLKQRLTSTLGVRAPGAPGALPLAVSSADAAHRGLHHLRCCWHGRWKGMGWFAPWLWKASVAVMQVTSAHAPLAKDSHRVIPNSKGAGKCDLTLWQQEEAPNAGQLHWLPPRHVTNSPQFPGRRLPKWGWEQEKSREIMSRESPVTPTVTVQPSAKTSEKSQVRELSHRGSAVPQPSQHAAKREKGWLEPIPSYSRVKPATSTEGPQRSWGSYSSKNATSLDWKGQKENKWNKMKGGCRVKLSLRGNLCAATAN